jgi:histidyl-tRNA synthetase
MQDIYGDFAEKFNFIINKSNEVAKLWGFSHLSTPILEFASLFERNLGDESDVVQKEIYKFEDKGGEILALRPEFTAGVVRSFIQNQFKTPARFFSFGQLFRYDRPQKGRYRQFHQINFENIGGKGASEDAQMIILAFDLIRNFGLNTSSFKLELNHLGSKSTLLKYKQLLTSYFQDNSSNLSTLSRQRLVKNPLRILDSKDEEDKKISQNAPKISSCHSTEEVEHFLEIQEILQQSSIDFCINEGVVRGLDYYTGVIFEFTTTLLGSQSAILGGGRYDSLIKDMGGQETPAIGFAGGVERLALISNLQEKREKMTFILPISSEEKNASFLLLKTLHSHGINARILEGGNLGKRLEKASKEAFENFAFVVGKTEMSSILNGEFFANKVKLSVKNLSKSEVVEGELSFLKSCLK